MKSTYQKSYFVTASCINFKFIFHFYNRNEGEMFMKIKVVYTNHCKDTKLLAEDMARYAKTYAQSIEDFDFQEEIDLLVLGFEDYPCLNDKELTKFISSLKRQYVKNIALFNLFWYSNKQMEKAIKLCQDNDLPLMRETYSSKRKLTPQKRLSNDTVEGGRLYIVDMITICRNYY